MTPSFIAVSFLRIAGVFFVIATGFHSPTVHPRQPQNAKTTATQHQKNEEIDLGTISGNVYTNQFLRMTFSFPAAWHVDKQAMDYQNRPQAAAALYGISVSKMLLEISQEEPEGARVPNPKILVYAAKVKPVDGHVATADELIDEVSTFLKSHNALITRPPSLNLGGQEVARMDVKYPREFPNGSGGYESDAFTIRNGYLIQFTVFASDSIQRDKLMKILNSLTFSP